MRGDSIGEGRPRRGWPRVRVSVRMMLAAVLVFAGVLGWFVRRAAIQRDAVAAIRHAGGRILYDWDYVSPDGLIETPREPWAPAWLVRLIGCDYFGTVVAASVRVGDRGAGDELAAAARLDDIERLTLAGAGTAGVSDSALAQFGRLTGLKNLYLDGLHVEGANLSWLRGLRRLERLRLSSGWIGDAELSHLAGMSKLRYLDLRDASVTDAGLQHLKGLHGLQTLLVSGPLLTPQGIRELRQSLPNLYVASLDRGDLMRAAQDDTTASLPALLLPNGSPRPIANTPSDSTPTGP